VAFVASRVLFESGRALKQEVSRDLLQGSDCSDTRGVCDTQTGGAGYQEQHSFCASYVSRGVSRDDSERRSTQSPSLLKVIFAHALTIIRRGRILKLLDREGLQFLDFNMPVFRKRNHHRGDAFTAFVVCFAYA